MTLWLLLVTLAQTDPSQEAMRLGRNALAAGRFEEAISHYESALKALPGHPGVLLNLCIANFSANHPDRALAHCSKVRSADPALAPARLFEGLSLLKLNRTQAAIAPLEAFLRVQPNQPTALLELANAHLMLGNGSTAVTLFERLSRLEPKNPKAWQGLAMSHRRAGEQIFEKLTPNSAPWHALTGLALLDQGQLQRAFSHCRQALALSPNLPGLHTAIAEIYRRSGHADWAATEQAKEPAKPSPSSYLDALRHSQSALEALEQLAQFPGSPELLEVQAAAARARAQFPESASLYERALALSPNDARLQSEYARALYLAHDYDRALPRVTRSGLHLEAGIIHLEQGNTAQAIAALSQSKSPEARGHLGEALLKTNEPARAIPHLLAASATDTDGRWHLLLSRAYQRTNQPELARTAQRKYQQLAQPATAAPTTEITPP